MFQAESQKVDPKLFEILLQKKKKQEQQKSPADKNHHQTSSSIGFQMVLTWLTQVYNESQPCGDRFVL